MLSNLRNIGLSQVVNHINNPNYQTGTLIEEIPTDFGRAYAGYKRGGILEGAEKFRKEVIAAAIWLFGIPTFQELGDMFCEKILKIPMKIGYSNKKDGRDAIEQCVGYIKADNKKEYLKSINCEWMDVSELEKYGKEFKNITTTKIKGAKQVTSIMAWALNCVLMGIVLPKVNQKITANKLKKQQEKENYSPKFSSMDEFQKNTKKDNLSFTGSIAEAPNEVAYGLENSNKFRLVSTDIPMIIGRILTARNKFEALEIAFMDTVSIYFYNFCSGHVQNGLRKLTSTPNINPIVADYIAKLAQDNKATIDNAINNLDENENNIKTTLELFDNNFEIQRKIYKEATYGKYGKLNAFVKDGDLKDIDKTVNMVLRKIKDEHPKNADEIKKIIKSINVKNAGFLACGLATSIAGLALIIPKLTFLITKLITGKDEFSGITDYSKK